MNRLIFVLLSVILALILVTPVQAKEWETDFKRASYKAERSGKYLLLYFSGSDWCGYCKQLEKEVFSDYDFKKYARKNLVCVNADFPRKKSQSKKLKEQNEALAMKYGVGGYPTIFILSPEGEVVEKTGYLSGGAKKYVGYLQGIIDTHKAE